jgi:hypothetical protein
MRCRRGFLSNLFSPFYVETHKKLSLGSHKVFDLLGRDESAHLHLLKNQMKFLISAICLSRGVKNVHGWMVHSGSSTRGHAVTYQR